MTRRTRRYFRHLVTRMPRSVRKEDCPGCIALVDDIGRFRPGFCAPDCRVREARDERIGLQR